MTGVQTCALPICGYVLGLTGGVGAWYKTVFNRLVDTDEIAEIIVNDVSFQVE